MYLTSRQSQTRNPKPETRNPKPETRNPKPFSRNERVTRLAGAYGGHALQRGAGGHHH